MTIQFSDRIRIKYYATNRHWQISLEISMDFEISLKFRDGWTQAQIVLEHITFLWQERPVSLQPFFIYVFNSSENHINVRPSVVFNCAREMKQSVTP